MLDTLNAVREPIAQPPAAGGEPKRTRRRLLIVVLVVLAVLAFLALLTLVAPTYVARLVVGRQLAAVGIEAEGVQTLDVDLWKGKVWIGPVRFRSTESQAAFGELGRLGLDIRLSNLFHRQALVEELIVDGIDVQVTREIDGTIRINGINPRDLRTADTQQKPEPEVKNRWGTGIDDFELRNARVFFTDRSRGTLTIEAERLTLRDFRTWEPEQAGTFALQGDVNGIKIASQGQAKPFADTITVTANTTVSGIEIAKIEEYLGTFGIQRRAGVLNADLRQDIAVSPDGRVDMAAAGTVSGSGFDIGLPDRQEVSADQTALDFDIRYALSKANESRGSGKATLTVKNAKARYAEGASLAFGGARLDLPDLAVAVTAKDRVRLAAKPLLEMDSLNVSGPTTAAVGKAKLAFSSLDLTKDGQEVTAKVGGSTDLENVTASVASKTGEPGPSFSAASFRTALGDVSARLNSSESRFGGKIEAEIVKLAAKLPQADGTVELSADALKVALAHLDATKEPEAASFNAAGSGEISAFAASLPKTGAAPAATANLGSLQATFGEIAAATRPEDGLRWRATLDGAVKELATKLADGALATATISDVALTGGRIDQSLSMTADSLAMGTVRVALTDELFKAFGGPKESGEKPAPPPGDQTPLALKLGRFTVAEGSVVEYRDTSVQPPVHIKANVKTLEVHNLDTVDPNERANVRLTANLNEFSQFVLSGWATSVGKNPSFDFSGKVEGLQLPTFSPYAAKTVGLYVESGQLTAGGKVAAESGKLNGVINLDLVNLNFGPLSPEDAQRLSASVGVPIETVVDLLQDSSGRIDLRIPISGDLTSPAFDLSQAIGRAIRGAVTAAIAAPFQLVFKPVSLIAGAVGGGGDVFKPIVFEPGTTELNAEAKRYIDQLIQLLKQRPKLAIQVCGRATTQDLETYTAQARARASARGRGDGAGDPNQTAARAMSPEELRQWQEVQANARMATLAVERTEAVRRAILEGTGIDSSRVGECRASFERNDKEPPRVEVAL